MIRTLLLIHYYPIQTALVYAIALLIDWLELNEVFLELLDALLVRLALVIDANDFIRSLLNARLQLRLELMLGQCSADIGLTFEAEERMLVLRHKTFEQLLVALKILVIYVNIESLLDLFQVFVSVIISEVIGLGQLVNFALFGLLCINYGKIQDCVHLAGFNILLTPRF